MYCRAHLVSASIWPGNEVTPCCVWRGPTYKTYEEMQQDLDQKFNSDNIPEWCHGCSYKDGLDGYDIRNGLQLLDIRNDNICNLKCRSCGPYWSSRWASELNYTPIRNFKPFALDSLDLSNLRKIYYCGGEPFLADQHVEVLKSVSNPKSIQLVYNTNCTTLYYKNQYIPDLWKPFAGVVLNLSIDAVGPAAEVVRSGTVWSTVESVLNTLKDLTKVMPLKLSLTPVLSSLNIWWIDHWLEYFEDWTVDQIWPITAEDDFLGLGNIPLHTRPAIIQTLSESKFNSRFTAAIDTLNNRDNTARWPQFVKEQQELDQRRNENWYEQLQSSSFWC